MARINQLQRDLGRARSGGGGLVANNSRYERDRLRGILLRNENASGGNADIWIEGVTFDGNDRGTYAQTGGAEPAFRCSKCTNLTIRNSRFLDTKYHAIHLLAGSALSIDSTQPLPQILVVPRTFAGNATAPFTSQTAPQQKDDSAVLGAEDTKDPAAASGDTPAVAASSAGWRFFGIAWYWWLLIVALVGGMLWWTVASVRRRAASELA